VEGGAVIFKNKDDFARAKRLINFGLDDEGNITEAGINAKLNEYQCAVGLALLDDIDEVIDHRAGLFEAYRDNLHGIVELPLWHTNTNLNGAYMPIKLKNPEQRFLVESILKKNEVQCRQYFSPSLERVFDQKKTFSSQNSQELSQTILCLPLHYYMTVDEITIITNILRKALA
jgi:dTDP-4-amino-4,6-dideoxygalactose transaminase